jgi:hypothetical protein
MQGLYSAYWDMCYLYTTSVALMYTVKSVLLGIGNSWLYKTGDCLGQTALTGIVLQRVRKQLGCIRQMAVKARQGKARQSLISQLTTCQRNFPHSG